MHFLSEPRAFLIALEAADGNLQLICRRSDRIARLVDVAAAGEAAVRGMVSDLRKQAAGLSRDAL